MSLQGFFYFFFAPSAYTLLRRYSATLLFTSISFYPTSLCFFPVSLVKMRTQRQQEKKSRWTCRLSKRHLQLLQPCMSARVNRRAWPIEQPVFLIQLLVCTLPRLAIRKRFYRFYCFHSWRDAPTKNFFYRFFFLSFFCFSSFAMQLR
jgi:hypothetical protein